jgi:uncharacterized protein with PIN domain
MIFVDSSAPLAILFREAEKQSFEAILSASDHCVISAVNAHETACVLYRFRVDSSVSVIASEAWRSSGSAPLDGRASLAMTS